MPANSLLGQRDVTRVVSAQALFAWDRAATYAEVLQVPPGGTLLELPDQPTDGDFYEWCNPDDSASVANIITVGLSADAILAGVTIQGSTSQTFDTPGTTGRAVFFAVGSVWQLQVWGPGAAPPVGIDAGEIVWRAGAVPSPGIVATAAEVQAAILASPVPLTVYVDSSAGACTWPAAFGVVQCFGTTTFASYNAGLSAGAPADKMTIDDGATLARVRAVDPGLEVACQCFTAHALAFDTTAAGLSDVFALRRGASLVLLAGANVSAIAVPASGLFALVTDQGVTLDASAAPGVPVISLAADATLTWLAVEGVTTRGTAVLTGPASAAVNLTCDASIPALGFAGWGFAGTVTTTLLDDAARVSYEPSTPADWSPAPSEVAAALDQLATRSAGDVTAVTGTLPIVSSGGATPDISINAATDGAAGSMSAADKTKLDGIAPGAAVSSVSGLPPIVSSGGDAPIIGILAATDATAGSMSAADKTKLDGIAPGAAVSAVTATLPMVSSGGDTPDISINAATDASAGSMSAADKLKLDELTQAVVIFRPGAVSAGPVVATWPEVQNAIAAANGFITVAFDNSIAPCVVPTSSGVTDCKGATTITAYNLDSGSGGLANNTLVIEDGATLHRPRALLDMDLNCQCTTTAALSFATAAALADTFQLVYAYVRLLAGATVSAVTPIVNGGILSMFMDSLSTLDSTAAGSVPIITVGSGATLSINSVFGFAIGGAATVTGGGGGASIAVAHDDASILPNFAAMGFVGTVTETRQSKAAWALPAAGTTASRPVAPNVQPGQIYFDTSLNNLATWSGLGWDVLTASSVTAFGADPTGAVDASGHIQTALNDLAGTGVRLLFDQTYLISANVNLPNNTAVQCGPGSAINIHAATSQPFYAFTTDLDLGGTLNGTPSYGGNPQTVSVAGWGHVPTTSEWVRFIQATGPSPGAQFFKITGVAGGGPYTLTLDKPMVFPFVNGDLAYLVTAIPENIDLNFDGATISGNYTAEFVTFANGQNLSVRNLNVTNAVAGPGPGAAVVGFDEGCYSCLLENFNFYLPGAAANTYGWYLQSCEFTVVQNGQVQGTATGGTMLDCYDCTISDHWSSDCATAGLAVSQFNATTPGCNKCLVSGGGSVTCGLGVSVYASADILISGYNAGYCTIGAKVDGSSQSVTFVGCSFTSSTTDGAYVTSGSAAMLVGCDLSKNPTGLLSVGTIVRLVGCTANSCSAFAVYSVATSLEVDGLDAICSIAAGSGAVVNIDAAGNGKLRNITLTNGAAGYGLYMTSTGTLDVENAAIAMTGASRGVYATAGSSTLRNVHVTGGGLFGFFFGGGTHYLYNCTAASTVGLEITAGKVVIDPSCDFSASATPIAVSGGTLVLIQQASIAIQNSTAALTIAQLQCTQVESSGNASGAVTITASLYVPGMQWTFRNNNTAISTTTFMGIAVAVGKTAIIRINSAGAGERVTADT